MILIGQYDSPFVRRVAIAGEGDCWRVMRGSGSATQMANRFGRVGSAFA